MHPLHGGQPDEALEAGDGVGVGVRVGVRLPRGGRVGVMCQDPVPGQVDELFSCTHCMAVSRMKRWRQGEGLGLGLELGLGLGLGLDFPRGVRVGVMNVSGWIRSQAKAEETLVYPLYCIGRQTDDAV